MQQNNNKLKEVEFSEFLTKKRKEKEWSKAELSRRSGVSIQYICDIEKKRRMPSIEYLVRLAKALTFSLDEFFLPSSSAKA